LTAAAETAICLSLLLGVAQRAGFIFGTVFSLLIWGVGEGFRSLRCRRDRHRMRSHLRRAVRVAVGSRLPRLVAMDDV
jgi:hypothetical protein